MMIIPLETEDGNILYIEVDTSDEFELSDTTVELRPHSKDYDNYLPSDAKLISHKQDKVHKDILNKMKEGIKVFSREIYSAFEDTKPDEAKVEFSIALKGKVNFIPVIASGSSESGIKVTLTWKTK